MFTEYRHLYQEMKLTMRRFIWISLRIRAGLMFLFLFIMSSPLVFGFHAWRREQCRVTGNMHDFILIRRREVRNAVLGISLVLVVSSRRRVQLLLHKFVDFCYYAP